MLYVTGTVNGSPFKNEFTFTGFVSKPDDYQMVNGAQAAVSYTHLAEQPG